VWSGNQVRCVDAADGAAAKRSAIIVGTRPILAGVLFLGTGQFPIIILY